MKKIISLALALTIALVLVLSLAGCTATNRTYRRTAEPNRYPGTYDGTYRTNLRPRTITPGDTPIIDGTPNPMGRTRTTAPAKPVLPSTTPGVTPIQPNRTNKSFNVAS